MKQFVVNFSVHVVCLCVLLAVCDCFYEQNQEYDFIIVGGGTAGSVVANRLSENPCFKVIVLEAGGEPSFLSQIPSLAELMKETKVDWNYTSTPQRHSLLSFPNRRMNLTQGKMLGGTGSINGMNFFRGNKLDYENWQKSGANGWRWKDVFKYFLKIETDFEMNVEEKFHGDSGPICVTNPGYKNNLIQSFFDELSSLGYNYNDPNGNGTQVGYSFGAINVCQYKRQTTYTEYLKPVLFRKNLKLVKNAFVEKIVFNANKRAIGVIYNKNNKRIFVKASKEIIVSAGALNSPKILMLSGIGPKRNLKSFSIPLISDLPVGENLQDHLKVSFPFTRPYEDIYNRETVQQFFENKGPLVNFGYGNAFVNSKFSTNELYPDLQLSVRMFSRPMQPFDNLEYLIRAFILRPKSKGSVRLHSRNAFESPIIDPNYLSEKEDVAILAEGAKIVNYLMNKMDVQKFGYRAEPIFVPACESQDKQDDKYWYCVVRHTATTIHHFSGTCKMGAKADESSVVDNKLNVIGVKALRVIDASIMPKVISANLQASVMMIAEKASSFIRRRYRKRSTCKPYKIDIYNMLQ